MLGFDWRKKSKERGASMINSIQQFQTEGVKKLEKVFNGYASDMAKVAEMVQGVADSVWRFWSL